MRIKKIVLEAKYFYSILIFLLVVCCLALSLKYFLNSSLDAFTVIDDNKAIHDDLDGDGRKDILYVKKDDKSYYIQVNLSTGESYSLNPCKDLPTLGDSVGHWPLKVSLLDITRDGSKEILVQSSFHGKPIQHLFILRANGYEDVFNSYNNIIGFADSKNNKTPKVVSAMINKDQSSYDSYIFIKDNFKKFDFNYPSNYMGSDAIGSFISLIQSFPNGSLTIPAYFYHNISGKDLDLLYQVANCNTSYLFQDGIFKDLSWDSKGIPHEVKWTLNFRSTSLLDNKIVKTLSFDLILTKFLNNDGSYTYKITSLNLK